MEREGNLRMGELRWTLALRVVLIAGIAALVGGCDKSSDSRADDATTVTVMQTALNADGSIKPEGLKQIEARSADPRISVTFVRSELSDKGLEQLAKFPNIRRVNALGSKVTDAGVTKLKQAVPGVEINH